jgi:hypothetical protein
MSAGSFPASPDASPDASSPVSSPVSFPVFERPTDRAGELAGKPGVVRFLEVAPFRAIMVDGDGQPGEATFGSRMPALYTAAYSLRFALKRRGVDWRVGLLEGLYWTVDGATDLDVILGPDRGTWRWTLLIGLPDEATDEELADALAKGRAKVPPDVAADLRIEAFAEGAVAQVLHLGPYADERPTIEALHAAIIAAGFRPRGRHHELYVGDPGRAAPAKLRTMVRQPVELA